MSKKSEKWKVSTEMDLGSWRLSYLFNVPSLGEQLITNLFECFFFIFIINKLFNTSGHVKEMQIV